MYRIRIVIFEAMNRPITYLNATGRHRAENARHATNSLTIIKAWVGLARTVNHDRAGRAAAAGLAMSPIFRDLDVSRVHKECSRISPISAAGGGVPPGYPGVTRGTSGYPGVPRGTPGYPGVPRGTPGYTKV